MFRPAISPVYTSMGCGKEKLAIHAESEMHSYLSEQCMSGSVTVAVQTKLEPPVKRQCVLVAASDFFFFFQDLCLAFTSKDSMVT